MSSLDVTGAASARTNRVWAIRVILALGLAVTCMLGAVTSAAASDAPTTRAGLQLVVPGGATHMAARGNVVATISADGSSVSIIDAAALTVRSTTALPVAPSGVALSPDGSFAYVTAGYEVFVVDTATGAVVRSGAYNNEPMRDLVLGGTSPCNSASRNGMQSRSPAMSPDGRLLYFVGDCHYGWPVIFSIDPMTMLVVQKATTSRGRGGLGLPNGPLAAFDDQAIVTGSEPNGGPTAIAITSNGGMSEGFWYAGEFSAGPFSALTRDPVTGALLASKGDSLVWVDPVSGAQARSLEGVGSAFGDVKVDPSTGLIYGRDGQGTVVVDPASGRVLGMIMTTLDAVAGGRGYHATATGVDVLDLGSGLVPTQPLALAAKVGRAAKGKVSATVTWRAPVSAASTPATAYLLRGYSYRNSSDKKPAVVATKVGPETTSSRITLRQVTTTNAKKPAIYAFTVTPISEFGSGASSYTQIQSQRK